MGLALAVALTLAVFLAPALGSLGPPRLGTDACLPGLFKNSTPRSSSFERSSVYEQT